MAFSGSDMRHREDTDSASDILTDWLVNLDAGTVDSERGGWVHKDFQGLWMRSGPYHHAGTAKYIDEQGVVHDEPAEKDDSGGLLQSLTGVVGSIGALGTQVVRGLPQNALTDHAPIFYAVHVWNNYVRS